MILSLIQEPKRLFLADAMGALLTAFLNFVVIAKLESTFGMPKNMLYYLGAAALLFAVYSLSCHFFTPSNPGRFIFVIATANILYCILTALLLFNFHASITIVGWLYFIGEIFLISGIAGIEFKAACLES